MSRVQLALNVSDLDEAITFYSKLFATEPAKVRPGYANFAIAEPPAEARAHRGRTASPARSTTSASRSRRPTDVAAAAGPARRRRRSPTATEDEVACCFALQDKVWVDGPDRQPWEIYTVLADVEHPAGELRTVEPGADALCCPSAPESAERCC